MIGFNFIIKNPKRTIIVAQFMFWICFFTYLFFFERQYNNVYHSILFSAKATVFYSVITYFHAFIILPILGKRQYLKYSITTLGFLFIVIFMSLCFEYLAFSRPEPKLGFSEYYNFSGGQIFGTIGSAINALIISALIKFTFDYFLLQKQQLEQSKSRLETEMKYLKAQINPHFLFNTLNSLLYLTRNKSDSAPDVVEKLSELMRYLLEHNDIDEIPLLKEIEFIKAYLELERIRIPKVSVKFKVNIKNENINIPTMLLLPLVENAFKHGINKNSSENYVYIEIHETEDIVLTVENSLWQINNNNTREGMGINNLKKRLNLLFGNNYKLTFNKNKKVFKSKLIIPKI